LYETEKHKVQVASNGITFIPKSVKQSNDTRVDMVKVKGKAIPLQAWTGPEGSRRLRLPNFKTIRTCRW
jgi:hypothetical protein